MSGQPEKKHDEFVSIVGLWNEIGTREQKLVCVCVYVCVCVRFSHCVSLILTYLLAPWSRVHLEKLTSKLCS